MSFAKSRLCGSAFRKSNKKYHTTFEARRIYIYESNETQYNVVCINCHAQWKTSIPVIWLSKKELQEQKKIREIPLDEDVLKNIEEEMKLKWENEFTDKKSGKAKQLAVKALKISRTFLGV